VAFLRPTQAARGRQVHGRVGRQPVLSRSAVGAALPGEGIRHRRRNRCPLRPELNPDELVWGWSKYGRLANLAAEDTGWLRGSCD